MVDDTVEKLESEVATLSARCAALESVAVDLLAIVEAIAPEHLFGRRSREPVRPVKGKLVVVSGSALRRRDALLTAAMGSPKEVNGGKPQRRAKRSAVVRALGLTEVQS